MKFYFNPRDLWKGLYIDTKKKSVYFQPIPFFGIKFSYARKKRAKSNVCSCPGTPRVISVGDLVELCPDCGKYRLCRSTGKPVGMIVQEAKKPKDHYCDDNCEHYIHSDAVAKICKVGRFIHEGDCSAYLFSRSQRLLNAHLLLGRAQKLVFNLTDIANDNDKVYDWLEGARTILSDIVDEMEGE